MLLPGRPHSDFNILPKGGQKVHQALDREVARLPTHQTGDVRLFDAQYRAGLCLREPSILDKPIDLQRKAGLELLTLGVGKAEVGKDVTATLSDPDLVVLLQLSSAFLCSPVLQRQAAVWTSSISF